LKPTGIKQSSNGIIVTLTSLFNSLIVKGYWLEKAVIARKKELQVLWGAWNRDAANWKKKSNWDIFRELFRSM